MDFYNFVPEKDRKTFSEALKYSVEFAQVCYQNPEVLKFFTQEDQEAILNNWTQDQRDHFGLQDTEEEKTCRRIRENIAKNLDPIFKNKGGQS